MASADNLYVAQAWIQGMDMARHGYVDIQNRRKTRIRVFHGHSHKIIVYTRVYKHRYNVRTRIYYNIKFHKQIV